MFQSITPQQIIDDCLALTDQDGYGLFGSSGDNYPILVRWINNELTTLWQWGRRVNRDAFTKVSSSLIIPSGSYTMSMTAAAPAGAAITDWGSPRGVDVATSTDSWRKLKLYNFVTRDHVGLLSYRFIGDTIHLQPANQASNYYFRVWYLYSAPVVTTATLATSISIPDGSDEYIKQGVAAKMRIKLDDDPTPHYALQQQAKLEVQATLATGHGDQVTIADVMEEVGPELW
jgi:hypothetical protein